MTGIFQRAAALLVGCLATIATGQSLIDAENLLIAQPPGFKIGYQSGHDNRSITEYVPVTETVEDWTQMLTVQVFRHATVDSALFLQGLGKRYMDDCPGTTAFRIIKGNDALYSVQRAWRSVPSDADLNAVMQTLAQVTVCDTRSADHACPSFDSLLPGK